GRPHSIRRRRRRPRRRHAQADLRGRVLAELKPAPGAPRSHPFALSWRARVGMLLVLVYAVYAATQLGFSWNRFESGIELGARFIGRLFPPSVERLDVLWKGIAESLEIAVLASTLGIL